MNFIQDLKRKLQSIVTTLYMSTFDMSVSLLFPNSAPPTPSFQPLLSNIWKSKAHSGDVKTLYRYEIFAPGGIIADLIDDSSFSPTKKRSSLWITLPLGTSGLPRNSHLLLKKARGNPTDTFRNSLFFRFYFNISL